MPRLRNALHSPDSAPRLRGLELGDPRLHVAQRGLLHGEHRRVDGAALCDEVGAVEAVAGHDRHAVCADAQVEVRGRGGVAPGVLCGDQGM